ncbi:hypothetical protein LPJ75_006325, partial [Coemansia sp. RSA 2598]
EPLPNFKDDSWQEARVFNNPADITDGELLKWCRYHYEEFFKVAIGESQPCKRVRRRTFEYLKSKIDDSLERRWILANPSTLNVSRALFKSGGIIDDIHMVNADISQAAANRAHTIPRCSYNVSVDLVDQIFPFIDSQETFTGYQGNGDESSWRESLTAFCKVLKNLRLILIQDMMLLFDVQFYRHMLRNTSLMTSDFFRSTPFANSSKDISDEYWNQEVIALINNFPRDVCLTQVRPEGDWQSPTRHMPADSAGQSITASGSQPSSGKRRYMHVQESQATPSRSSKKTKTEGADCEGASGAGMHTPVLFKGEVIDLDSLGSDSEAPDLVDDSSVAGESSSSSVSIVTADDRILSSGSHGIDKANAKANAKSKSNANASVKAI